MSKPCSKSACNCSTPAPMSAISQLVQRNPDLLGLAEEMMHMFPEVRDILEEAEEAMLKEAITTKGPMYLSNRTDMLALYTRLGYTECARMIADDILR